MTELPRLAVLGCLVVLAFAGRGSTNTKAVTKTKATDTATKATFIAAGDAICRASNAANVPLDAKIKALEGQSTATITERLPPIMREAVTSDRGYLAKLQALPEPVGEATTIAKWLVA